MKHYGIVTPSAGLPARNRHLGKSASAAWRYRAAGCIGISPAAAVEGRAAVPSAGAVVASDPFRKSAPVIHLSFDRPHRLFRRTSRTSPTGAAAPRKSVRPSRRWAISARKGSLHTRPGLGYRPWGWGFRWLGNGAERYCGYVAGPAADTAANAVGARGHRSCARRIRGSRPDRRQAASRAQCLLPVARRHSVRQRPHHCGPAVRAVFDLTLARVARTWDGISVHGVDRRSACADVRRGRFRQPDCSERTSRLDRGSSFSGTPAFRPRCSPMRC